MRLKQQKSRSESHSKDSHNMTKTLLLVAGLLLCAESASACSWFNPCKPVILDRQCQNSFLLQSEEGSQNIVLRKRRFRRWIPTFQFVLEILECPSWSALYSRRVIQEYHEQDLSGIRCRPRMGRPSYDLAFQGRNELRGFRVVALRLWSR
jgi:hypothetical protein